MVPSASRGRGATKALATFAANVAYDLVPDEVITIAKNLLLDTLGTTLAGTGLGPGCQQVVDLVRGNGGTAESTLIGYGDKLPALAAAFANGALAHALNYDAVGLGHVGLIVPAPLAAAERAGGISGKQFITALVAGGEVMSRLGAASSAAAAPQRTALEGQVMGYFGAACSAARVMRLDPHQMHSVLGLALMQASGTMQPVFDGDPPAKAIYAGFSNHGGLLSALLAAGGLTAECDAIEGKAGIYGLFYRDNYEPSLLEDGLGEEYLLAKTDFKPWPTSGIVHPFIEASLALVHEHNIAVGSIQQVHLHGCTKSREWFEPVAERKAPANAASAANSVFYAVGKALAHGAVGLADFTDAGLGDKHVQALTSRMDHTIDADLGSAAVVEIVTDSGTYTKRIDQALGHFTRPMSRDQLVEKFRDCARHARMPLPDGSVDHVVNLIDRLEDLSDMGMLVDALAPPDSSGLQG